MITTLRRLFWVALLAGAGYAGWLAWQSRSGDDSAAPEWPPLDPPPSSRAGFADLADTTVGDAGSDDDTGSSDAADDDTGDQADSGSEATPATWVAPVDGKCPDGYPIKANDNSGIFHVPGGRFYERTVPERCYADAHDAEADGYRRAKA